MSHSISDSEDRKLYVQVGQVVAKCLLVLAWTQRRTPKGTVSGHWTHGPKDLETQ